MISLIHPSRGRPEKSFLNAVNWVEKAGCEVEVILSLDKSDEGGNVIRYHDFYHLKRGINIKEVDREYAIRNQKIIVNDNTCVVDATNHAAKICTGDILIYLSDDFDCFDNWGLAVQKEFEGVTTPLLIKVDDCLQDFIVPVLTIPIMNRALYNRLGYFWHPDYKSMFVDEDLYWTTRKLSALKYCPHLKFVHNHVSAGRAQDDETYRRSAANWNQGKELFRQRKAMRFPV